MFNTTQSIVGLEALARALAADLVSYGFTVTHVDSIQIATMTDTSKRIALSASVTVDPKAASEPWSIVIEGHDTDRWLSVNCIPTSQLNSDSTVALVKETVESGRLSLGASTSAYFVDFSSYGISDGADLEAFPLTLYSCATDHGIAFHVSVDGSDNTGVHFSWAVIQRPVSDSTMKVPSSATPLFAVFRPVGSGDPDTHNPNEVLRFTVREHDIQAATLPVTACGFAPDVHPIINMMQQVSVTQDNNALVNFPQMINTHRHVYRLVMDMLGYTSADIVSAASEVPIAFTGQPERNYLAMNANGANNRGVRILLPMY